MPIHPIELKQVDRHAENIYEAIVVLSKRARQINEEMKIRLNQELEMFTTRPDTEEEIEHNPEQERISKEYEKLPKPTQAAIAELLGEQLSYRYKED
jgi:hypothetical protein